MTIPKSTKYLLKLLALLICFTIGVEYLHLAYEYETIGHGLVPYLALPIATFCFLAPFMKPKLI